MVPISGQQGCYCAVCGWGESSLDYCSSLGKPHVVRVSGELCGALRMIRNWVASRPESQRDIAAQRQVFETSFLRPRRMKA